MLNQVMTTFGGREAVETKRFNQGNFHQFPSQIFFYFVTKHHKDNQAGKIMQLTQHLLTYLKYNPISSFVLALFNIKTIKIHIKHAIINSIKNNYN